MSTNLSAPPLPRHESAAAARHARRRLPHSVRRRGLRAGRRARRTPPIPPEINAWVVVQPDDTVVIRIARSEMGQGTLTGLAQLVAEELDCDWAKVTTEYPTPGQNLARNRVWGNFSTGGSRGIRESQEYVRKGGATARMMLVQAAADAWKVPVAECVAADSVITHKPSGRTTTYGRMSAAAGEDRAARRRAAEGPQGLEDRRQAPRAAGHRRQGHRRAGLRHGPEDAGACSTRRSGTARCSAARSGASTPPRC